MKKLYSTFLLGGMLLSASAIAQCIPCGTGSDGAFTASSSTTLPGGTYNYTTFTINTGATVTVTGTQPLVIYCSGNVVIDGTLDASGTNGGDGVTFTNGGAAGVGVAGGQNGAPGNYSGSVGPLPGTAGNGLGAGGAGGNWSGGGGAGYATAGQSASASDGIGGPAYGNAQLSAIDGGSGGGGGSGGYGCGSGGGGGGGGYIYISSCGTFTIGATGIIRVNGGNGGSDGTGNCGGGGGGSGGSLYLIASGITNNGTISATGGLGGASQVSGPPYYGTGGNGATGRIRIDGTVSGTGTVTPAAYSGSIAVSITSTSVTCNGACDGTATASVTGGTPGYTYSWMPGGQTTSTATGLCAGTYTLTVTDANGCTGIATVVITEPTAIVVTASTTPATCNGACDGTATATVTGGTPGYTYSWMPGGQTTSSVTGLCAGTYSLIVTDANGCTSITTVVITEPTALVVTASATPATCNGACDGTATATVTGGTPGYTYSWMPGGQTTSSVTGLCAGTYSLIVTDTNGCTAMATVTITEPPALNAIVSVTQVTCFGSCDGYATVTVTGGTPGYTYSWIPAGGTGATATGLCAGTYSVLVTDTNGCTTAATATVTEPSAITAVDTFGNVTCNGACDGWISVIPSGGSAPYTFAWSNGSTTQMITNLCAGCYTVVITDANGCTLTEVVCITEPTALAITSTHTDETSSSANDGTASVSVTGGTPGYSYLWAPGGDTTASVTGLDAGLYIVTVTDSTGCSDTVHITIGTMNGLDYMNLALNVSLFPNPTNGQINLVVAARAGEIVTVEIFDVTGRRVSEEKYTGSVNEMLDLSGLQSGVYWFRVSSGNSVVTQKVVLNR